MAKFGMGPAVVSGLLVATLAMFAWFLDWMRRNVRIERSAIDLRAFRAGLLFGLPMMATRTGASGSSSSGPADSGGMTSPRSSRRRSCRT